MKLNVSPRAMLSVVCLYSLFWAAIPTTQAQRPNQRTQPANQPAKTYAQANRQEVPKFALLVGINKYLCQTKKGLCPELLPLDGSENDANLMLETLVQDYGFANNETHIKMLKGPDARAENIRKGFQWLIENAKKSKDAGQEAVIVFHYSGHGSETDDPDCEKPGCKSETIVPYDSRQGDVYDIIDHEINDFVIDLTQYTSNVTLIFDSCHSGTVSRGDEELIARETKQDQRQHPKYARRHPRESIAAKSVTLSAAASFQRAYERDRRSAGKPDGAFTYNLCKALKRAHRTKSYRELMDEVKIAVKNEIPSGQDPQIEGDQDRPVFGGTAERAEPYITIAEVDQPHGTVTFNAGEVHGVKKDTKIAIYAGSATSYKGTEGLLATATVTEKPEPTKAVAEFDEKTNPNVSKVDKLSKVILVAPNFGDSPLLVDLSAAHNLVDSANSKPMTETITTILKENRLLENGLVQLSTGSGTTEGPRLTLKKNNYGKVFPSQYLLPLPKDYCNPPPLPKSNEEVWYVDDGTGRPLFGYFGKAGEVNADDVVRVIDRAARQRTVLALANKTSTWGENIKTTLLSIPGTYTKTCDDNKKLHKSFVENKALAPKEVNTLDQGEVFELKFTNTSSHQAYVTVIDLATDGQIKVVYPDGGNPTASLLPPGASSSLGKLATTPPAGTERYVFFVTQEPTDFTFLEVSGIRGGKGTTSLLEKLLSQSGSASRGEHIGDDSWATFSVGLVITGEKAGAAIKSVKQE